MNVAKEKITVVSKKDLDITWFNNGQKGGQHSNRHNNCCRISHKESGITVQSTEHKSAKQNQTQAFKNLVNNPRFQSWLKMRLLRIHSGTIEEYRRMADLIQPNKIKIEALEDGQWVELQGEEKKEAYKEVPKEIMQYVNEMYY